eukprot:CAMPEP_0198117202 /NCGR_PEP_ID=MMETSP1442-20131203/17046_1 /TAXON_ID= /ORGANISM="Craspedostauros australis, Strain CCMP3328" /LENGTH=56 /DNA_ID=CAMNT_0043775201 /DNA_START=527 /DNA_END=693 /DNA_ORIENTATION=+
MRFSDSLQGLCLQDIEDIDVRVANLQQASQHGVVLAEHLVSRQAEDGLLRRPVQFT